MALQDQDERHVQLHDRGRGAAARRRPARAEIVLYASKAPVRVGSWQVESDSTAAGGAKMRNPNAGAAKITTAVATPANYFEMTFNAEAGRAYRLWLRGKADSNDWANDSVFVQFNNSVTSTGAATWRIGTTSAPPKSTSRTATAAASPGWGWQDNGYGNGVLGPLIYFATTGPQTLRVQVREDGLSIDQIVLSHETFLTASPGTLKNDTTDPRRRRRHRGRRRTRRDPPVIRRRSDLATMSCSMRRRRRSSAARGRWKPMRQRRFGSKLRHANAGAAKLATAARQPGQLSSR